jgi:hypothetical protein
MADVIYNNTNDIIFFNTEDEIWMRNIPTLRTYPTTGSDIEAIMGHGFILDTGGEDATRRGFCYTMGSTGDPTILDSVVFDDGSFGLGEFHKLIEGLVSGDEYKIRAYGINSVGIGYGITLYFIPGVGIVALFRDIITPLKTKQVTAEHRIKQVLCTPILLQGENDMLEFSTKQNWEEYFVVFNFVRVITPLTSILTADVYVYDESGTDVTSSLTDPSKLQVSGGTKVFVWVQGGSEQTYKITCKIVMSNGEKFEQDASILVEEV